MTPALPTRYISHELRTPLNAVSIGLRILTKEVSDSQDLINSADNLDTLKCMSGACDAAIEVLNDILCYDKVDSGTLELRKEDVNIISFISETSQIFRPTAQDKRIEFIVEIYEKWDDDCSWGENTLPICASDVVKLDVFKMRQVIRNVLSNALKFTPEGGTVTLKAFFEKKLPPTKMKGKTRASVAPVNLQCENALENGERPCSKKGYFLRICVSDTGIGIDLEHQTKMFSEIFQFKPE